MNAIADASRSKSICEHLDSSAVELPVASFTQHAVDTGRDDRGWRRSFSATTSTVGDTPPLALKSRDTPLQYMERPVVFTSERRFVVEKPDHL